MKTAACGRAIGQADDVRGDVLVSAGWLAEHLDDPNVRVVEMDVSPAAYDEWHIDGATLWNIYRDLKDADYRPVDSARLEQRLVHSGITPESTIVFYGYAPCMGMWLMKLYGHLDARILDCSREMWRAEGRPWSSVASDPGSSVYHLEGEDERLRADHAAVRAAIGATSTRLVDVRSESEYRGERFWPSGGMEQNGRAGHVPSAVHQPIDGLYDVNGSFRSIEDLQNVFSSLDLDGDQELITYCTIGGRASTAWFVLSYLLGRDHVRVYDGSWAEWGRLPNTHVEAS